MDTGDVIELKSRSSGRHSGERPTTQNISEALWVYAKGQDVREPRFSGFSFLHHLNILSLEHEIIEWHTHNSPARNESFFSSFEELTRLLRAHTQAVQDFDYLHHLKDVNKVLVEREYLDRERKFLSFLKAETFPRTRYKTFERRQATQPDLLLNWLRAHLWKKLSWSKEEKVARRHAYISGEDPQQFSLPTRLITSLTIAVGSAAFFVIPTVLMTLPETVSIAWSLTTMSLAILVFGACAALFMGPEPNTQDVVGATAAYAAVLVVFYGNIVNNLQSK